jgi:endonuclease YncB( thermonuclease family)
MDGLATFFVSVRLLDIDAPEEGKRGQVRPGT